MFQRNFANDEQVELTRMAVLQQRMKIALSAVVKVMLQVCNQTLFTHPITLCCEVVMKCAEGQLERLAGSRKQRSHSSGVVILRRQFVITRVQAGLHTLVIHDVVKERIEFIRGRRYRDAVAYRAVFNQTSRQRFR